MANGPLGNEPGFPGTGKFIVGTISPLTDTFIDSNVGGHFGPLLKLAGFDALAVSGKSEEDVIILIDGDAGTISLAAPDSASQNRPGCSFLRRATFERRRLGRIQRYSGGGGGGRRALSTPDLGLSTAFISTGGGTASAPSRREGEAPGLSCGPRDCAALW